MKYNKSKDVREHIMKMRDNAAKLKPLKVEIHALILQIRIEQVIFKVSYRQRCKPCIEFTKKKMYKYHNESCL